MIHGSCLCGGIQYEVSGPLEGALNCHCKMCRKAHGAAFRSRARVNSADFKITQGDNLLKFYESSPGNHRGFCSECGTPILSRFDNDSTCYGLPLGALDDDPGLKPQLHVYVAHKAPWHDITDRLPQYDKEITTNTE
ncbi:GFA family protein [Advenella incenata]|uniref:GFA family protein n=1 Tax=Advenella incenata TaxID=267800 RepID=UPI001029B0EB|nr:GFA family protein [Advenella incenata]